MLKGIRTAVAVAILTCFIGVSTVHAQIPSKQLTSLDVFATSCKTDPQEFLYALRFGPKLGVTTSNKDNKSGGSAVFASSKGTNSHFLTEITAKESDGSTTVETSVPSITPTVSLLRPVAASPTPTNLQLSGGLDPEVLFNMANSYRASLGLPGFEKDALVCEIAAGRGPELNGEMANGNMHAGLFGDNHPFWITENMISMRTNEEAFNWWLRSSVHRGQLQGDFKYACAACAGNTCVLVFTNYISK